MRKVICRCGRGVGAVDFNGAGKIQQRQYSQNVTVNNHVQNWVSIQEEMNALFPALLIIVLQGKK